MPSDQKGRGQGHMWGYAKKASKSKAAVQRNEPISSDELYQPDDLSTDVLELQHAAGNQAVGRILDSAESVPYGIPPGLHPNVKSVLSNAAGRPLDERTRDSMEQADVCACCTLRQFLCRAA